MAGKGGAVRAGRAYVELFADNSSLVRGLKQAERRLQAWGRKLQSIGSGMTKLGLAGAAPLGISAKMFASFEDGMLMVKAVTSSSKAEFDALSAKARELGATTSYTATQVAGAMLALGRAGFAPTEIDQAIAGMLNLARATGMELPISAEIAAGALRAFGMEAGEMGRVADVLVATANNSAQTLEDLGESMKYVAPVAAEFGLSIEDTAKSLGTLANVGIKGSMAGTSIRQMMLSISNAKTQKKLREMGVETLNASGNLRNFGDIMIDVGRAMASMSNAKRLDWMKDLFKQRAVTGAVKLAQTQFARLNAAIDNSAGVAQRQAAEMDSGLGGVWRRMMSAIQEMAIQIGEVLSPAFARLGGWVTMASAGMAEFVRQNAGLVVGIGVVTASLLVAGPLITGLGTALLGAGAAVGALTSGLAIVGTALAAIATPAGAAVAAVAGLGVAFATLTETGRGVVREFAADITTWFADIRDGIAAAIGGVANAFRAGNIALAIDIAGAGMQIAMNKILAKVLDWSDSVALAISKPASLLADLDEFMGMPKTMRTSREREQDAASRQAERLNKIAAQEAAMREMIAKADKGARLEAAKAKLAELKREAALENTPTPATEPTAPAGIDPELVKSLVTRGGDWFGRQLGNASNAVGAAVGTLNADLPAAIEAPVDALAQSASLAAQSMATETRGTFSSIAAARMGGFLSVSPAERTARGIDKLVDQNGNIQKRIEQLALAAKNAKLVFAGQLP